MRLQNTFFAKFVKRNGYVYVPDNIDTEWLIQFSYDNIALLKATVDSKLFTLHCTEMMAWQRSSDNSLTESYIQQGNRPAKLDQVLTRFHKLDKPNFHQMEDSIAVFKIE